MAAARLGAAGQAWELAWAFAVAAANGEEFGGLAVDFRKAYDSVRIALMERFLQAARWPVELTGPLWAAYLAPRRLRVAGAIGPEWEATSGVPAGCPLAVDVLAVLTWAWAAALAAMAAPPVNRRYVDDLTAWASGPRAQVTAAVAATWATTKKFAGAFQLDIHPVKTVQLGAARTLRQALAAAAPDAVVRRTFKDLGVHQVFGAAGAAEAGDGRALAAWDRFRRCSALPLPYHVRVRAGAAAGVAAAT
jgi:hypothetical protein